MSSNEYTPIREPAQQNFVVRSATAEDIVHIASLDRTMWSNWANPPTLYRQLIDLFPETVLVAHAYGGQYAGCAVGLVRAQPSTGWVLSVDIAEEFRGHGLGRLFLTELFAAFRRLGAEKVVAIIDPVNKASQRLFSSFGFVEGGLEKDYFGPGKHQQRWEGSLGG